MANQQSDGRHCNKTDYKVQRFKPWTCTPLLHDTVVKTINLLAFMQSFIPPLAVWLHTVCPAAFIDPMLSVLVLVTSRWLKDIVKVNS